MRRLFIVRPAVLSVLVLSFAFAPLISRDASAERVNKLFEIRHKIRKAWNSVGESREEEKIIRSNMEKINKTIGSREKDLRDYERRVSHTQAEVAGLATEIEMLKGELDGQKQQLKEYINFLYKQQHGDNAFVLASATDYQDLSRKSKYMSLVANYENRVIQKYISDIQEINSRQRSMEVLLGELEAGKEAAREKKRVLQTELSRKGELLAGVKEKQIAYEKKIRELEASSQKIQGVVTGAEKKKIPEAITGSGFVSAKGHLPWPVRGKVLIPYGEYRDTVFNIRTFKNGVEIEAGTDAVPRAVAGGRVIFASPFENYGMLLIIDHGNGYNTLYGNLSDIPLQKNDLLIQGTDLGKITRSKFLNTPALYFEIRHNGKPVDPAEWMEKRG